MAPATFPISLHPTHWPPCYSPGFSFVIVKTSSILGPLLWLFPLLGTLPPKIYMDHCVTSFTWPQETPAQVTQAQHTDIQGPLHSLPYFIALSTLTTIRYFFPYLEINRLNSFRQKTKEQKIWRRITRGGMPKAPLTSCVPLSKLFLTSLCFSFLLSDTGIIRATTSSKGSEAWMN